MGLFKRRKKNSDPAVAPMPGVPAPAAGSHDFDVLVRQLIRQMAPAGSELIETDRDSIKVDKVETNLGNLRNGWNHRQPGERETWLRDTIHGFFLSELRDQGELDLSMLRPGMRSEWYLAAPGLSLAAQTGTPASNLGGIAHRRMGPGLVRVLLWDTPTTMSMISDRQIDEWGSNFDELWSVAVRNLAADPVDSGWGLANDVCWMPVHGDDYTAERMFIDGHTDKIGIAGDVVMFHPNRATLILVDPANAEGIALAAQIATAKASEPNPVTLMPYIGRGMSWRPLDLPANHPASDAVGRLQLSERSNSYAQQKDLLAAIHGEDLFVATYKAFQVDDRIVTVASWTEGAVSLLPRADVISFVHGLDRPEPEVFTVDWATAAEIVGTRLEPTDHWPERWRVTTFPDPSEVDRLRAASS